MLERNNRREGPMFKGDENLLWSQEPWDNFELEDISLIRLINSNWFLRPKFKNYNLEFIQTIIRKLS